MIINVKTAEKIRKRNGNVVPFDRSKIRVAIEKANRTVEDENMTPVTLEYLTEKVCTCAQLTEQEIPTVEEVQDRVEEQLIALGFAKTAKAYILYRAEHAKIRQAESDLMDIYKELTFQDAKDADIKRENANIDADTAMGTML